jgi:hypothetical protein
MKKLLLISLLALSTTPAFADGKAYTYIFEKKMSLENCLVEMSKYAKANNYKLEMWEPADFYVLQNGEFAGNAYYSAKSCYIYIR